jgi:aryl-alcohol dehydrogenase-like predicted oxidoreductase
LKVPVLSFGTATFGGKSGTFFGAWGSTDVAEATRLVDMCLDAGANLFARGLGGNSGQGDRREAR